ncbi:Serine/threonine-protein kinase pkn1 [Symmachiella dynata]|uniref:Serine/threonine-protein kinase pkn1 n=1 Tax=Symmachiella dynata TaxID=2527995 RepID=A0A517ZKE1_9PLAN|nr:formylglycine-generating enzyme family protein [Symmachiella dynata]QDU42962.1 Serine/threonine-protein kinase pkn1 [Symmachiella dynata]
METLPFSSVDGYGRRAQRLNLRRFLSVLCVGLLWGCGGGDEATPPPAVEEKPLLTGGEVKPRPKVVKKSNTKRRSTSKPTRRRKKPPGIPITPMPEEEFASSGNADEFEIADEPFAVGESFSVNRQEQPLSSTQYAPANTGASDGTSHESRVRLPKGFAAVPGTGISEEGWPQRIVSLQDEAEMVLIPAGLFTRGVDGGPEDAGPQHQVQLDSYYIDLHEVTFAQYRRYRRDLSANNQRLPKELDSDADGALPATGVRWGEAGQYARWAGKELPTEAEWEKAARGNVPYAYPWGDGKPIWHRPRELSQIDPVESFRGDRSPFGVMDLAGNAREWCQDWYSAQSYQMALDQSNAATLLNPPGPRAAVGSKDRTVRVVRGSEEGWEIWRRSGIPMGTRSPTIGFRCVWRLGQGESGREDKQEEKQQQRMRKKGGF